MSANFSPAVRAGDLLLVSGQASVDDSGIFVPGDFEAQVRRSIENVQTVLSAHGLELADVVRVGAYVHELTDLKRFNEIYSEYFAGPRPARTTLTGCLGGGVLFEMDVMAWCSGRKDADG